MADGNLYGVVVQRRLQAGAVQLNYTHKDPALSTLAILQNLKERKLLMDDFGARISFDPEDIAHVLFIDIAKSLEFQASHAEMTNKVNIALEERARREKMMAQTKGGILLPISGGVPNPN